MGLEERVDGQNKTVLGNSKEMRPSWVGEVSLKKEEPRRKRAYGRIFIGSKAEAPVSAEVRSVVQR